MLSRLRTVRSTHTGIARIFMVAMLGLVLLAGMIPSAALSAIHICRMACCADKPAHEAGACEAFPTPAEHNETTENAYNEHSSHHDGSQTHDVAVVETTAIVETEASSHHTETTEHASPQQHQPQSAPKRQAQLSFKAFTKPCSNMCAAAALASTQVRRPRDAASHSIAARPGPPTFISRAGTLAAPSFSSAERRRQSRPRAPPVSPVNSYA